MRLLIALVLALAAVFAGTCFLLSCSAEMDRTWGIPGAAHSKLDQLTVLELPRFVDNLCWLKNSRLAALDLSHCEVNGLLADLPSTLTVLLAKDLRITEFRRLPSRLERIDFSQCDLTQIKHLPDTVKWLALGGNTIPAPVTLPPWLRRLEVERMDPTTFADQSTLTELRVVGSQFASWRGQLPVSLTELTVESTLLKEIPSLPASVTILSLETNAQLKIPGDLPPNLTWFSSEGAGLGNIRSLLSLKTLKVRASSLPEELPPWLEELSFTFNGSASPRQSMALPALPKLRKLSIKNYSGKVTGLPEKLDDLDIAGTPEIPLTRLPRTLRKLTVADWSLVDYGALPRGLKELDISQVEEILNASVPLANLKTLIYRGARGDLPALNDGLEVLDIGESPDLKMLPPHLPSTLTELRLRDTGIRSLPLEQLPNLEVLDVCQAEIRGLAKLPQRLLGLRVHAGQLADQVAIPLTLSHLSIRNPVDCNEDGGLWQEWIDQRRLRRDQESP